jgi:hypothetical protein
VAIPEISPNGPGQGVMSIVAWRQRSPSGMQEIAHQFCCVRDNSQWLVNLCVDTLRCPLYCWHMRALYDIGRGRQDSKADFSVVEWRRVGMVPPSLQVPALRPFARMLRSETSFQRSPSPRSREVPPSSDSRSGEPAQARVFRLARGV